MRSKRLRASLVKLECCEPRRLLSTVTPDATFGSGGVVFTDMGGAYDFSSDMLIQPDGKILVSGTTAKMAFAMVRYNANGTLDSTFGTGGKAVLSTTYG